MSYVEVIVQTAPIVQMETPQVYNVMVDLPTPMLIEVQGIFPTTFINPDIDGGIIF